MEYVMITYPVNRKVYVDGQYAGETNDTLMVERGHHVFALGDPQDYAPTSVEKVIEGTTIIKPMIVADFHSAGGGE